jgi:stress-induced morphogen
MTRKRDNNGADHDEQNIRDALSEHMKAHPGAKIDVQRRNSVSIRIRIIDPDFKSLDLVQRDNQLWKILEKLPEDLLSRISLLLLMTPNEAKKSLANFEFDRHVSSSL